MRRVSNPPSRFESVCRKWEVEPPAATLEVLEDNTRTILARNESPDVPFRWSVNPYRGCGHACAYCYARPGHEYLGFGAGTDFDTRIVIKPQAPELLRAALHKPSWTGELIAFSGDTDCYQPLEAVYRLTRRCLEVCAEAGNPVGIISKSFLITRDVDVLSAMAAEDLVSVAVSVPFADEELARLIEPGAPRPAKRFEAMARLSEAGVPVEVLVGPLIPGLNDDQIPEILARAREAGAEGASSVLLRLPGPVRDVFFERLRAALPLRADRIEARIRDSRGGRLSDSRFGHRMRGEGPYWQMIEQSFELHRQRNGLTRTLRRGEPASKPSPPPAPAQMSLF